jgi:hypothetical protein
MGVMESSVAVAEKTKRQGVFQRLFRPRDPPPEFAAPSRAIPPRGSLSTKRRVPQALGMRTLCVRSCDGYYFPISSSSTRKRFKIDEAVCKAMYGGAEANLFVHDNSSPPETAVSLKGKPLAREPYAFAFRETFNEACQAELKTGLTRLAAAFLAKQEQSTAIGTDETAASTVLPHPLRRPPAGNDPETVANRAGGFIARPTLSSKDAAIVAASRMRKLGSDYYYADSLVIPNVRDRLPSGPRFTLIGSAAAEQTQ